MNNISLIQSYTAEFSTFFSFQYYGLPYKLLKGFYIFLLARPFVVFSTVKLILLGILKLIGIGIAKVLAIIPPISLVFGLVWGGIYTTLLFFFTILLWVFFIPDAICKFTGKGWFPET